MTAYISVSFSHRRLLMNELAAVADTLAGSGITPFIFTDNYLFSPAEEREMMKQAMTDIDRCDLLVAEGSDKAIGIGIEAGYAKAKCKPVIYLRKKETAHSTTLSGISDFSIVYDNIPDLRVQLTAVLKVISEGTL